MKKQILHTIVWKEDTLYVAKFVEFELASQGKTKKEAQANLKEVLDLYLHTGSSSSSIDILHFIG